jgi:hypothetical protein
MRDTAQPPRAASVRMGAVRPHANRRTQRTRAPWEAVTAPMDQEALFSPIQTVIQWHNISLQDGLSHERIGHRYGSEAVTRMEVESA